MRSIVLLISSFLITACVYGPEPKTSDASVAQVQIQENRLEAEMAQKEYEKLQSHRDTL